MKKLLAILLAAALVLTAAACAAKNNGGGSAGDNAAQTGDNSENGGDDSADYTAQVNKVDTDKKIGVILVGDENESYSHAHIEGILEAAEETGFPMENISWRYSIPEDELCLEMAEDLVSEGCGLIISNAPGHSDYMRQAAEAHLDVTFIAAQGEGAADSGLDNFKNANIRTYEAKYLAGVAAGMKLKSLMDAGSLSEASFTPGDMVKTGYVATGRGARTVSGFTAYLIGMRTVVPNAALEVKYTDGGYNY
ncbi:MAG: BMP family ABC transporter substrate-binding protein, partial [Oscillospiraceae bacterium]|nr:BMP family ABC transporter substrate-binding protein [Oscillospiraceae bacterium]